MPTASRKSRQIEKTAYDTYASDSKIAVIIFQGERFHLRAVRHPDLYQEYINRKDIAVDFSGAKTPEDIEKMRAQFVQKFQDAPTPEEINTANKACAMAHKKEQDAFCIENMSQQILADLARAGSDKRISDERYSQIIEYVKMAVRAVADGKDINSVQEPMSPIRRVLSKIAYSGDTLSYTKHYVNEFKKYVYNTPKESLLRLVEKLPTVRLVSGARGHNQEADAYYDTFINAAIKSTEVYGEKYDALTILLFKDKIRVDALRTFDKLAQQHMDKLKKERVKIDTMILRDAARQLKKRRGQRRRQITIHNLLGGVSVDPVARSIAKIKRDAGRK